MRSLLISLILFCSLTQFAICGTPASPAKVPTVTRKTADDCGTIYICYAPEICTNKKASGKPIENYTLAEVTEDTTVTEDCPAIIRYHIYATHYVHMSIESFQPIEEVDSVELVQMSKNHDELLKFACFKENDKLVGLYKKSTTAKYWEWNLSDKLKCTFAIKEIRSIKIIEQFSKSKISIKVGNFSTKEVKSDLKNTVNCDPSLFEFNDELQVGKLFAKVEYEPGKYYCKEYYNMEYRKIGSTVYEPIDKVTCDDNFNIANNEDPIDVRCAAEAKYFCDYAVKAKDNETPLELIPMDWNNKTGYKLEASTNRCPSNKRHMIMVGEHRERPIYKPIECLNYGGDPIWTVDGQMITASGPELYCTNELRCNLLHKIPASSVRNGFVNKTNFLPECEEGGEMSVGKDKVLNLSCDLTTGDFKYKFASNNNTVERIIDDTTIFSCKYKTIVDTRKDEENQKKILEGSLGFLFGAVGFALVAIGIVIAITCIRLKLDRRRMDAVNNDAWMRYAADPDEKYSLERKNKKVAKSAEKDAQDCKWNALITSRLYECRNALTTDEIGVGGSIEMARKGKFLTLPDESKGADFSSMVKFKGKMTSLPSTTPTYRDLVLGTTEDFANRKKVIAQQREGPKKQKKE